MEKEKNTRKESILNLGCSCMTLTSVTGKHYWFRTCDLDRRTEKEVFEIIRHEKGKKLQYTNGEEETNLYKVIGISYTKNSTWLLDGINEKGLCGGLLMLPEGTSTSKASRDKKGCMGMEAVTKFLTSCKDVHEIEEMAKKIQMTDIIYQGDALEATVHFFFRDLKGEDIILEAVDRENPGIFKIYKTGESLGVMTNSPAYDKQKENLWWFLANTPRFADIEGKKILNLLEVDGKKLKPDLKAEHMLNSEEFPGGYDSWERFIRITLFKALNKSGNLFPDEKMLALGSGIMNTVREPEHQGIFHKAVGEGKMCTHKQDSKTHYLVMYDLERREFHLQFFDDIRWSKYTLQ